MKKSLLGTMIATALAGAMIYPVNMSARASASPGTPAGQDERGEKGKKGERKERKEQHPFIQQAIKNLEAAKQALQRADRDFGGHRTEAVKHTDMALEECRKALASDVK